MANSQVPGFGGNGPFSPPPRLPAGVRTEPRCSSGGWKPIAAELGSPTTQARFAVNAAHRRDRMRCSNEEKQITYLHTHTYMRSIIQIIIAVPIAGVQNSAQHRPGFLNCPKCPTYEVVIRSMLHFISGSK